MSVQEQKRIEFLFASVASTADEWNVLLTKIFTEDPELAVKLSVACIGGPEDQLRPLDQKITARLLRWLIDMGSVEGYVTVGALRPVEVPEPVKVLEAPVPAEAELQVTRNRTTVTIGVKAFEFGSKPALVLFLFAQAKDQVLKAPDIAAAIDKNFNLGRDKKTTPQSIVSIISRINKKVFEPGKEPLIVSVGSEKGGYALVGGPVRFPDGAVIVIPAGQAKDPS